MGSKDTNFSLNHEEVALLSDPSFFIRKKQVTCRIIDLFGELEAEYDLICKGFQKQLPQALLQRRGKISRGENYRGFPYVILDYPALFEKEGVFAYRTLMWWGHPFSFTFHISGKYFNQHGDAIIEALHHFDDTTFICINQAQWEHHHEITNYIPLNEFLSNSGNAGEVFHQKGFLKLSKTIPLEMHEQVPGTGTAFLKAILNTLQ
jgi:hypothetical protein